MTLRQGIIQFAKAKMTATINTPGLKGSVEKEEKNIMSG
jgi:hypothetical protein